MQGIEKERGEVKKVLEKEAVDTSLGKKFKKVYIFHAQAAC